MSHPFDYDDNDRRQQQEDEERRMREVEDALQRCAEAGADMEALKLLASECGIKWEQRA